MQQGPALPVLSLEGKEEESSGDGKESGALESAPLGPLSLPAGSRGSPKFPRRAPILRTALWVGALLTAFTLIHVCVRAQRSRAAVKKSGLARRRLAEGGGGLGDSDDDEEVQAIIEDCLSLAEDLSGHSATEFPLGWGDTTGALTTLSFPQEAFSDGEPGPSLSSWAPATLHLPTPGYPHAGHAQLPPDPPATGSWHSWETPAPAEEAALLSALESDSWLDQIPLIQPQLQSGSWLEYIPSVLQEVQPSHSQGAPGAAGEAAGGPPPEGAFYPPTLLSPFSPFASPSPPPFPDTSLATALPQPQADDTGPPPFPDTSLATALPQPQADDTGPPPFPGTSLATALPQPQANGTPQASAPPTGPRASAGPSQGYPSTAAEQAEEGETPSAAPAEGEQPQGLLQVLQGAKPRGAPAHPFVRLPLVHPGAMLRSFNPAAAMHSSHTGLRVQSLLLWTHELYARPSLSPREVNELLALLESLVRVSRRTVTSNFKEYWACGVAAKLSTYFLILDSVVAAQELLGDRMQFNLWFKDFAKLFKLNFVYKRKANKKQSTQQVTFYGKMIARLKAAMRIYKKGVRPPLENIIMLKRMIFCSSMSPPLFLTSMFDPWRLDDARYREAAGETSQAEDDASGLYENIDEEEEDEDEEEEEEE